MESLILFKYVSPGLSLIRSVLCHELNRGAVHQVELSGGSEWGEISSHTDPKVYERDEDR